MTLYIVVPCYNEEEVLPLMAELLLKKLNELIDNGIADGESRLFLSMTAALTAHGKK